MYKLVAIDLDGTLLNSYGEVTQENKDTIQELVKRGIKVVLASGRISDSVFQMAREIGADEYFISGNGAMIYDIKNDNIIYERFLEKSKILELVKMCEENSIYYNIYTQDAVIAKSLNYNIAFYNYENQKTSQDKKTKINIVENVYEYIKKSEATKFLKMTICDENKGIFLSIMKKLKQINDIDVLEVSHMSKKKIKLGTEIVDVGYFYTEVTRKNVDKWYAIKELMKRENIKQEEVIAIGDNMNDQMMISQAGFGVAMEHSNPEVKKVANYITLDNNSSGVARAIKSIMKM